MSRFSRALAALVLALCATGVGLQPATARPPAEPQPYLALDLDFPDPALLAADGKHFAYSTNAGGLNLPVSSADDLYGDWSAPHEGLPTLGTWASVGFTWAPDVTVLDDGSYLVYYTARHTASGRQCVGTARAEAAAGPFVATADEPLFCPVEEGGAIDAATFIDHNGDRYVTYKNDGNAIGLPTHLYLQQVADDGVTLIGEPVRTLENDPATEGGLIEAPYLIRHHDHYYLFYSYGQWWNESYTTTYAVADSLGGPWTRADTPLMTTRTLKGSAIGPGGASFLGEDLVAFHGVRNNPGFYRATYLARMGWRGDRPVVVVKE